MVGTILPVVYGERVRGKHPVSIWLHTLGYVVAAGTVGGLLGVLGAALPTYIFLDDRRSVVFIVTGLASALYSLRELNLVQVPAPQFSRQVPETWRFRFRPGVAALLYGLGLGVGFGTRVPVSTFYAVVLWATLLGSPTLGAVGMAVFGLGRALPLLCMAPLVDNGYAPARFESLIRLKPLVQVVNAIALGFTGSCLLSAALMRH